MTETPMDERAEPMLDLYREGQTLEMIGQAYDLTRERVRQILTKSFGDYKTVVDPTGEIKQQRLQESADERRRTFEETYGDPIAAMFSLGEPDRQIAEALGISPMSVMKFRSRHKMRHAAQEMWTDAQLIEALQDAAEHFGGLLNYEQYQNWRADSGNAKSIPSALTIVLRFEKFSEACAEAGVAYGGNPPLSHDRSDRVTEEAAVEWAEKFVVWASENGFSLTLQNFSEKFRGTYDNAPCATIMSRRLKEAGGWVATVSRLSNQ